MSGLFAPGLYAGGASRECALPSCGKYWGLRLGRWVRVQVLALPRGAIAGRMRCEGPGLSGAFWGPEVSLKDCAAFWGPVPDWGDKPPSISKARLLALGVNPVWADRVGTAAAALEDGEPKGFEPLSAEHHAAIGGIAPARGKVVDSLLPPPTSA